VVQIIVDGNPHVIVIAVDDIEEGEEIFADYGRTYHQSR